MTPTDELIAALRAEAERLSGRSLQAGGVDCGITANLAEAAADRLASLSAERDQNKRLVEALRARDDEWQSAVQKLCVDVRVDDMPLTAIAKRIIEIRAALAHPEEQR